MELITIDEAAERLRVTPAHVRYLAREGRLAMDRTSPRKTMIRSDSVEDYINANNYSNKPKA